MSLFRNITLFVYSVIINLVLRIGITGHRFEPDNTPEDKRKRPAPNIPGIENAIREILEVIKNTFKGIADVHGDLFDFKTEKYQRQGKGVIRIISALASGADQWVARIASETPFNFELQAVLPFHRNEYIQDFTDPAEISEFGYLLNKAGSDFCGGEYKDGQPFRFWFNGCESCDPA